MSVTETFRVREINGAQEYWVISVCASAEPIDPRRHYMTVTGTHFRLADWSSALRRLDVDTFEIVKTGQLVERVREMR